MAQAMNRPPKIAQVVGPYETWIFGDGRKYSGSDSVESTPAPKTVLITALGELPPNHGLLKSGVKNEVQGKPGMVKKSFAYTPTLWEGGYKHKPPSNFSPMVIEIPRALRDSGIEGIRKFLNGLLGTAIVGGPKPQYGFRLNNLISASNFDSEFGGMKIKPVIKPDLVLLERLAKLPAPKPGDDIAPLSILAVIDDLLPFAHRNTLSPNGGLRSRMEFCWLQSADIALKKADRTVLFGREHTRRSIENLLAIHGNDEDELYRVASNISGQGTGYNSFPGLWSHGAAVLDIAGGYGHQSGMHGRPVVDPDGDMDRVRLIGVQLPSPAMIDTVGFGKDCYLLSAFHYIFDRADRIEAAYNVKNIPLIINLSFGFTGGPHDGADRPEEAIKQLIKAREAAGKITKLVMPSGNNFQSGLHGEVRRESLDGQDRFIIPWRIQPNDQTSSYLEIWYPLDENSEPGPVPQKPLLVAPGGQFIELDLLSGQALDATGKPAGPPQTLWRLKLDGEIIGQLSIDQFRGMRWRVMLILAPTETRDIKVPVAPSGLWTIQIMAPSLKLIEGVVACRIQRDTSPVGSRRSGRQSYFDYTPDQVTRFNDDGTLRHDDISAGFVRRFGTLNGLSTHDQVLVVGGVVKSSGEASEYSSAGRIEVSPGTTGAVTCSAPSDESLILSGQTSAGMRSGSSARIFGTSGAAPHVSRGIAIGYLEPGTSKIVRNTPIKGMTAVPPSPNPTDQTKFSRSRLGIGAMKI